MNAICIWKMLTDLETPLTILFTIITRMKLLFSNCLGDCSYSCQGSFKLISITVTVSLFSSRLQLQK